jgi:FMN phosphatase YigB (HAD superfamily)
MTMILTDCDGVLLNWEYAFNVWMERKGYTLVENHQYLYNIGERYGINKQRGKDLIRDFNESAMIGFLPPLRDSIEYVQKLHREHGYVFHVISSLSLDPSACQLRTQNLQKLFGETVFDGFTYLDTGADKDDALAKYKDKEYYWIEDKVENAEIGLNVGLKSILIEHGFNMDCKNIPRVKNWRELYDLIA